MILLQKYILLATNSCKNSKLNIFDVFNAGDFNERQQHKPYTEY